MYTYFSLKKIVIYLNKRHKTISTILYPLTNTCGVCVCVYCIRGVFFYKNQTSPLFIKSCLMSCYDRPFHGGSPKGSVRP